MFIFRNLVLCFSTVQLKVKIKVLKQNYGLPVLCEAWLSFLTQFWDTDKVSK